MFAKLLISLGPVASILLASEILWRTKVVKGERARKFIHILAGSWMAFWSFYLPFDGIIVLGSMALTLLVYSRVTHLFHGIYAVKRRTYGELLFALAIISCALLGKEPWIFTTSILFLALADGAAAVVGRLWGITNQYLVFGSRALLKSRAGTVTYFVSSYIILILAMFIGGREVIEDNLLLTFAIIPIVATLLENIGAYGLDNLFTPLFITLLFNSLL